MTEPVQKCTRPARNKKPDYIGAIVSNAVLLVVASQILNWGLLPFLTQDFKQMLPIIYLGGIVTIIFNAIFLVYNRKWFTSALQIVINAVGIAILMRYLRIFPFDFSAYGGFEWTLLAKIIFYFGIAGLVIAIIVEFIQMIVALVRGK